MITSEDLVNQVNELTEWFQFIDERDKQIWNSYVDNFKQNLTSKGI